MGAAIKGAFGRVIRRLRTEKGIGQDRLAEISGLHRTYVGSIERGERNLSLANIERLAQSLGVTLAELFANVDRERSDSLRRGRAR